MRISATGESGGSTGGFSLVEMLVALAVVGLLAGVVVLTLPPPRSAAAEAADDLTAGLRAAAERAVVYGTTVGVVIAPDGWRLVERRAEGWTRLRDGRWPATVTARLTVDGSVPPAGSDTPFLRFDATGGATPFRIRLDDPAGGVVLAGAADGAVTVADDG